MMSAGQEGATRREAAVRARYVQSSVEVMSPGRMIVALYDRLLLDLERAQKAIGAGEHATTHECLIHAQTIIAELHDSLDVEQWPAGQHLASLYLFVYNELVTANLEKDTTRVASCRGLIIPLRDAWREAAGIVQSGSGTGSA
jgi:flagellar protein FliS